MGKILPDAGFADGEQDEAQARFWVSETGKRDFAASFLLRNADKSTAGGAADAEEGVLPVHLHFR